MKNTKQTHAIPRPSKAEVEKYLVVYNNEMPDYVKQENSINKLFNKTYPANTDLDDILAKASVLNAFYSTNIFKILPVAEKILGTDFDSRIKKHDFKLVNEIADVNIGGKNRNLYSFASKYCAHHAIDTYPIFDSYVEKMLKHFRKADKFADFKNEELKNYPRFHEILLEFRRFYGLDDFSLRDIDHYLWLAGKKEFKKDYKKK